MPGPPRLQQLATATLIQFRDCLADIGDAPVDLLGDVLAACSADQLAAVEDGTLEGSGRCLAPWTWPLWHALWQKQFEPLLGAPAVLPQLPAAAEVAGGPEGVAPADYRAVFVHCQRELEQRRAESGARLRALREQGEAARLARHAVVVDPLPRGRRQRAGRPLAAPPQHRSQHGMAQGRQAPSGSAKERLLKKLGLGSSSASASKRSSSGQHPASRRTIVIRPVTQPGGSAALGGGAAGLQALHGASPSRAVSEAASLASTVHSPRQPGPQWRWQQQQQQQQQPSAAKVRPGSGTPLVTQQKQRGSCATPPASVSSAQQPSSRLLAEEDLSCLFVKPSKRHLQPSPLPPRQGQRLMQQDGRASRPAADAEALPAGLPRKQAPAAAAAEQQQRRQQGSQQARACRPAARLQEVDLFAGLAGEQAPRQTAKQPPQQPAAQQQGWRPEEVQQRVRKPQPPSAAGHQPPPAKRRKQQQQQQPRAVRLIEADIFDGL